MLDRDYAAGIGGVFWQDTRAAFQGHRDDLLVQNYLTGLCGGDVTPPLIDEIIDDLAARSEAGDPVWAGIEGGGMGDVPVHPGESGEAETTIQEASAS